MNDRLLNIINRVRANKSLPLIASIEPVTRLREDLGFDSLDLAELTVRIEGEFKVDVFKQGIVRTVAEVLSRIQSE